MCARRITIFRTPLLCWVNGFNRFLPRACARVLVCVCGFPCVIRLVLAWYDSRLPVKTGRRSSRGLRKPWFLTSLTCKLTCAPFMPCRDTHHIRLNRLLTMCRISTCSLTGSRRAVTCCMLVHMTNMIVNLLIFFISLINYASRPTNAGTGNHALLALSAARLMGHRFAPHQSA